MNRYSMVMSMSTLRLNNLNYFIIWRESSYKILWVVFTLDLFIVPLRLEIKYKVHDTLGRYILRPVYIQVCHMT